MRRNAEWFASLVGMVILTSCVVASPPSRLAQYVGSAVPEEAATAKLPASRPLRTALVVVADQSAPDSAPVLPDEALARVGALLTGEINRGYPVAVERVVKLDGMLPGGAAPGWAEIARQQGMDYLLVTVLSSTEQEYPISLFLGWTTHQQPGFRRDNWSLAEAALIDGSTGRTLLRAEGRAMATLDRPTAPGISQWYPVIYLRPQDPERRMWPPTYEGAPLTLRLVAMEQAAKRLAGNLQRAWVEQRDLELASSARS
ncbi:MAG: hypothetical protein LZF60_200012 [Nitrospira sp.]|nr:hypothetical protein [Nitrospira sp.]ULA60066.1 MAG: hypothetical protein LZF60_200012 [Nitrospira sp.]